MFTLSERIRACLHRPKVRAKAEALGLTEDEALSTTVTIQLKYPMLSDFTVEIARYFRDSDGPNFVELQMVDPISAQTYLLTVRPYDGIPASKVVMILREALNTIAENQGEPSAATVAIEALRTCRYLTMDARPDPTERELEPLASREVYRRIYADLEESRRLEGMTADAGMAGE